MQLQKVKNIKNLKKKRPFSFPNLVCEKSYRTGLSLSNPYYGKMPECHSGFASSHLTTPTFRFPCLLVLAEAAGPQFQPLLP
jgi:hypothetical protein